MLRIVSLLPSATEIVCELGLGGALVGVTHECDYPPLVRDLPKVTRTLIPHDATSAEIDALVRAKLSAERALYSLDFAMLDALQPDLIVTQALCDVCAVAESEVQAAVRQLLSKPHVVNLEPQTLAQVLSSVHQVGKATGEHAAADAAVHRLQTRVDAVTARSAPLVDRPRVVLLEWIDPPFSCGHWNPELVCLAGGIEGLGVAGQPSRTLSWSQVLDWQPEVLVLACCGFTIERTAEDLPRLASYPHWHELPCVRTGRVFVTDGSAYFSRPGPRLVDSLEILAHALHPEIHPLPVGLPAAVRVSEI